MQSLASAAYAAGVVEGKRGRSPMRYTRSITASRGRPGGLCVCVCVGGREGGGTARW